MALTTALVVEPEHPLAQLVDPPPEAKAVLVTVLMAWLEALDAMLIGTVMDTP
jgi:hypothetical protein